MIKTKAIVTVKVKQKGGFGKGKVTGACPLNNNTICSDKYGAHHSFITEGKDLKEIANRSIGIYENVTRIEIIEE